MSARKLETQKTPKKSFDHYFRDFEQRGAKIQEHAQKAFKEMRLAKTQAYHMAVDFLVMQAHFMDQLVPLVKSSGMSVDCWLGKWFEPMDSMYEDNHRALLVAVDSGLTLKKYLTTVPSVFLNDRKKRAKDDNGESPTPGEPPSSASLADREAQWRRRAQSYQTQLREARQRIRDLAQRLAVLEKATKRMKRELGKVMV